MTRQVLSAWARLIRAATREGWPPNRLDAEMAKVGDMSMRHAHRRDVSKSAPPFAMTSRATATGR